MGTVLERLDGVSKAMRRLRRELDTPNHRFDPKEVTRKVMIDLDALRKVLMKVQGGYWYAPISKLEVLALIDELRAKRAEVERLWALKLLDETEIARLHEARIAELRASRKVVEAAVRYRQAEVRYSEGTLNERVPNGSLINEARKELDAALAELEASRE